MQNQEAMQTKQTAHVEETTCCIAGAGPAGAVLALLLARKGIPVILLEEHMDFDRDFHIVQKQVLKKALASDKPLTVSPLLLFLLRLPIIRTLPAKFIGFGPWRAHVKE